MGDDRQAREALVNHLKLLYSSHIQYGRGDVLHEGNYGNHRQEIKNLKGNYLMILEHVESKAHLIVKHEKKG